MRAQDQQNAVQKVFRVNSLFGNLFRKVCFSERPDVKKTDYRVVTFSLSDRFTVKLKAILHGQSTVYDR